MLRLLAPHSTAPAADALRAFSPRCAAPSRALTLTFAALMLAACASSATEETAALLEGAACHGELGDWSAFGNGDCVNSVSAYYASAFSMPSQVFPIPLPDTADARGVDMIHRSGSYSSDRWDCAGTFTPLITPLDPSDFETYDVIVVQGGLSGVEIGSSRVCRCASTGWACTNP